jgi:hypothetical protein
MWCSPKITDEGAKSMFKKNASGLDRKVPLIVGVALIPIGLFLLAGTHKKVWKALSSSPPCPCSSS